MFVHVFERQQDAAIDALLTYGDDALTDLYHYGETFFELQKTYGDDFVTIYTKYKTSAIENFLKYQDELITIARTYGDDGIELVMKYDEIVVDGLLKYKDEFLEKYRAGGEEFISDHYALWDEVFEPVISSRPSWMQSELDAAIDFPEYRFQISFLDGDEVSYGTKGSVRPDYYKNGYSVDIKNYNVESERGRNNLAYNIEKQYYQRIANLPKGTQQLVMIDIRGQDVSEEILDTLYDEIKKRTQNGIEILFKKD